MKTILIAAATLAASLGMANASDICKSYDQSEWMTEDAMKAKAAEGLVWTEEEIGHLLENPKGYVPGTKMSFAGLRKEEERADVIAYLATFAAP